MTTLPLIFLSSTASSALPLMNQFLFHSSMTTAYKFTSSANRAIALHQKASWMVFVKWIMSFSGRLQIFQDFGRFVFSERLYIKLRKGCRSYETSLGVSSKVQWFKRGSLPSCQGTSESPKVGDRNSGDDMF